MAYELLRRRDQWRKLVDDPSLVENTVEEGVRFVSPVQFMARVAIEDVELEGVPVAADTTCLTMVAAANRDESVFADPDTFDIGRPNAKQHLGFGFGRHYCLAQALARLEGRIAFETLAARFPGAELAVDPADVEWAGQLQLRRVASLPVRLGPDTGRRRQA
jgi:cytochrome P450